MSGFGRRRAAALLVLAALTMALLLYADRTARLPPLEELPGMSRAALERALLGRSWREVHDAWGTQDYSNSWWEVEGYLLGDNFYVFLYYDWLGPYDEPVEQERWPVGRVRLGPRYDRIEFPVKELPDEEESVP